MKTITMADIRACNPCYDPNKYAPEDWSGTMLDILKHPDVPAEDKLWLVCREGWIDDRTLRLFACRCAEESFSLQAEVHPASRNAVDVARRYANGEATDEQLSAAESAAWSVARSARSAARSARSAARSAESAAWSAAESAAESAARSARSAVWNVARSAQVLILIELLNIGQKEGK